MHDIILSKKKTLYSLEFEDPFVAFHLEPDGRCQLGKKETLLYFGRSTVYNIKSPSHKAIEVRDIVVPS